MNVVLRPVNDRFLNQVAFPAFEQGAADAAGALQRLREAVSDERTMFLLESLLDSGVQGGFFTLDADRWLEAVYRLLFSRWEEVGEGWKVHDEPIGYAGGFDATLELTLLLEEPAYPYAEQPRAEQFRDDFLAAMPKAYSLSRLICGAWEPVPAFAPDQVLNTQGRGFYRPQEGLAVAEWAYRSAEDVARLYAQLPAQVMRLVERERSRLAPLPVPEARLLLAHWLEGAPPPTLAVAFSGLGLQASQWTQELGVLLALLRQAASSQQGLTCVMTDGGRQMADGMEL
jgi:hypothetical protein